MVIGKAVHGGSSTKWRNVEEKEETTTCNDCGMTFLGREIHQPVSQIFYFFPYSILANSNEDDFFSYCI
jgi:hypothetical protein